MTQQPMSKVLARHLTMQCLDGAGGACPLDASLSYHPSDPYAVWITFHPITGDVRWAMARSLLSEGLFGPAGEGDIQLWPSVDDDGRAVVMFEFCSPDGELIAHVASHELFDFLARTESLVPFGAETVNLDVDSMIDEILNAGIE